jgi:hypothetical protein
MKLKNLLLLFGVAILHALSLAAQSSQRPTTTSQQNVSKQTVSLVTVPFSATPTFNANNAQGFKITLTGNVISSTVSNGAQGPALVLFRIVQDSVGGHAFTWPKNVRNAGPVNAAPNARSVQVFAVDTDGGLDAVGPIQYSYQEPTR